MALNRGVTLLKSNRNTILRFDVQIFKNLSCSPLSRIRIRNLEEDQESQASQSNTRSKSKSFMKEIEKLSVWKDENALVEDLHSNIVYYEPDKDQTGVVIINKPYGLPKELSEDSQFSLVKALPDLAKRLDVSGLTVLKCSERFTSGITVLGSRPESEKAFKNCLLRQKSNRVLASSYLALVKGQPKINRCESVDLSLVDCPEVNTPLFSSMHKEPVISRQLKTVSQSRRLGVRRVHVDLASVSRSGTGAGLVAVSPSHTGKHFILVYLAELGLPVLGDLLYDYRSKTVLGKKVKMTATANANRTQVLPPHLLELLELERGEEWRLPKLLHHHRLQLPGWLPAGEDLTVFAPPPPHWLRAASILGINFDYEQFVEADQVKLWDKREENQLRKMKKKEREQSIITDLQSDVSELS